MVIPSHYLFAYGSLLSDAAPRYVRRILRGGCDLGAAYVNGNLYDLGDYPGLVLTHQGEERVFGKVFRLRNAQPGLHLIDRYEGYHEDDPAASEFLRISTDAHLLPDGRVISAWLYIYNNWPRHSRRIRSGDYLRYLRQGRRSRI